MESVNLDENQTINILSVAYFLASKFAAYHNRGNDPRTSHDFEDIIYVLDNRVNLVNDIRDAPDDVRKYLTNEFSLLADVEMEEAVLCHLEPDSQFERHELLMSKLKEIIEKG